MVGGGGGGGGGGRGWWLCSSRGHICGDRLWFVPP